MKRLLILRHAKSSWAEVGQEDHDRPLNGRGRRAAAALGDWLTAESLVPDEVLCSTALRTRQTVEGLGLDLTPRLIRGLYHAAPSALLKAARQGRGQTVMIVGHNPGIAEFAQMVVAGPPAHPRFQDYPTAALTIAEVEDWPELAALGARNARFVIPADLE